MPTLYSILNGTRACAAFTAPTVDFSLIIPCLSHSGLSWTKIRNDCVKWRRWLDSEGTKMLPIGDYTSSSFWEGTLPAYRETVGELDESEQALYSLESFESDDEEIGNPQNMPMTISTSLAELNLE
jgi:hypothetical protein